MPFVEYQSGDFIFYVQANNGNCFSPVTTHNLHILPALDLSFEVSPEEVTPPGEVNAAVTNPKANIDYLWLLANGDTQPGETINFMISDGTYNPYPLGLTATDEFACQDTTLRIILISYNGVEANIPNIFTPNGDGINDIFGLNNSNPNVPPFLSNYETYTVNIFNRWGGHIASFEEGGYWDGGEVADGTYFYVITGKDQTGEDFLFKGDITLVRGQ
jgi:gliding motility-associated-like protein